MILVRLESCASTNDEAKRLARDGAPHGAAVVAAAQTAGRGTRGRTWHSAPGVGLYVSVVLRPPLPDLEGLPLRAARAVRDALRDAVGIDAAVEPPNDLVWGGRKIGGILCEAVFAGPAPEFAVVGLGLNVAHGPLDFPAELAGTAASLSQAAGRPLRPDDVLGPAISALRACGGRPADPD